MAEKDLVEKLLEDEVDVFADIVNALIFRGKKKVSPSGIISTGVHSMYKADTTKKLHEQERDVLKGWHEIGVQMALIGLENQTAIDPQMPLRVIGYDGASYRSQYGKKLPVPVVTLVLYFGTEKRWDTNTSLKEVLDVPEELDPFVNDYRVHVVNIAWLSDEEIDLFQSDFKIVANFFAMKRKNKDYVPNDPTIIKHVDKVLKFLSVMAGDLRYEQLLYNGEEVKTMCDVAERLTQMGFQQGIQQGNLQTLYELVESGDLSLEKAIKKSSLSREEFFRKAQIMGFSLKDE